MRSGRCAGHRLERALAEQEQAGGRHRATDRRGRRRRPAGPSPSARTPTRDDVDLVVVATGGVVSLLPVLAALRAGKVVATANKETLVAGGHLVMPLAANARGRGGPRGDPFASPLAWLRPIDSEHSAIWQCLVGERWPAIERLILTASGGPFLDGRRRTSPR